MQTLIFLHLTVERLPVVPSDAFKYITIDFHVLYITTNRHVTYMHVIVSHLLLYQLFLFITRISKYLTKVT